MSARSPTRGLALALVLVASNVLGTAGASGAAAKPSIAPCALGSAGKDLRGFFATELARSERRFAKRPRARRLFAAGVAAYVYGLAPVAVNVTTQRFLENQLVSIAALTDPTVRTVVLPNHDTTYTVGRLQLADGPRVLDVPDARGRYYVVQLLDAYSGITRSMPRPRPRVGGS